MGLDIEWNAGIIIEILDDIEYGERISGIHQRQLFGDSHGVKEDAQGAYHTTQDSIKLQR
jgi:hypothetical protein